jgi:hypothetical protein
MSDLFGRHVVRINESSESRQDLADRLRAEGCSVNLRGRDWHHAGDFKISPPSKAEDRKESARVDPVESSRSAQGKALRQLAETFNARWTEHRMNKRQSSARDELRSVQARLTILRSRLSSSVSNEVTRQLDDTSGKITRRAKDFGPNFSWHFGTQLSADLLRIAELLDWDSSI